MSTPHTFMPQQSIDEPLAELEARIESAANVNEFLRTRLAVTPDTRISDADRLRLDKLDRELNAMRKRVGRIRNRLGDRP